MAHFWPDPIGRRRELADEPDHTANVPAGHRSRAHGAEHIRGSVRDLHQGVVQRREKTPASRTAASQSHGPVAGKLLVAPHPDLEEASDDRIHGPGNMNDWRSTRSALRFVSAATSPRTFFFRGMGDPALYGKEGDPEPVLRSGKSLALLAYLALSPGQRAPRQHLAELLWPGVGQGPQQHCLRQCLYRLRQATSGSPLIRSDGHEILGGPGVRFDFLEGEAALAVGDYERAERLLRRDFLEGLSIPEAREFEMWAESKRAGFRSSWVRAARTLAEDRLAGADLAGAVETAESIVTRRPFDETAIQLLMAALAASGQYALAVARFQAYARLLRDELDEEPSEELGRYARELRGCAGSPALRPNTKAIFVGRSDEWAVLEETWRSASDWDGALVLVRGEAGDGKTCLLAEFSDRVRAGGSLVLSAKCSELMSRTTYGWPGHAPGWSVFLPGAERMGGTLLAALTTLLPELRERFPYRPDPDPLEAGPAPTSSCYRSVARCLRDLAGRDGLLITVDDLHRADDASLELLHFLARHLRDARVLVLATFRPQELSPAGRCFLESAVSQRLVRLISLGDDLNGEDVEDPRASEGDAGEAGDDERLADYLTYFTGGNPALLYEVLHAARNTDNQPDGPP